VPSTDPDQPQPLDYFAPNNPARGAARWTVASWVILLLSWVPYLCGIVNASTVARSYVPTITQAHFNATLLCFALGLLLSLAALMLFLRTRDWPGSIAAAGIVIIQATIIICLGAAT
jgi:hypothetical protein